MKKQNVYVTKYEKNDEFALTRTNGSICVAHPKNKMY